jgi:hypothetical protein
MESNAAALQQVIAAWVQAIGSILAIAVTALIFWKQSAAERRRASEAAFAKRLSDVRRAQAVTFWAVEAIGKGAESRELGGAGNGLPFRPARLDHLRQMLEQIAQSSDDNPTSLALLMICHNLDDAFITYTQFPDQYRDVEVKALYRIRKEAQDNYDRIVAYQQRLESEAFTRGVKIERLTGD